MKKTYIAPATRCVTLHFEFPIALSFETSNENNVNNVDGAWTKQKGGCEWKFSDWNEKDTWEIN